ncbi:hypothetical protein SAMN05444392_101219 [Seinonella peptonophila]|uniref:Uncharacterized protein n=1 Tax=Seinonella peptonophila TaxID=112248 RepID=A0A1M4SZ67_9BACL|nr:hypothetical protein SAMN05444392_101219 [Seinonella peptonophila]
MISIRYDTAFLLGVKPAIFVGEKEKVTYLCQEQGYPYITNEDFPYLKIPSYIFFQNERLRDSFRHKYRPELITNEEESYLFGGDIRFISYGNRLFHGSSSIEKEIRSVEER